MFDHYYALIMAGGGGTRLWPLSRKNTPKQLLPLVNEYSMFRTSVERLADLFPPERIFISTIGDYVEAFQSEAPQIPAENFIVEPYGKNTAPAAALAIGVIHSRDPEATVAMTTADHHIGKVEVFLDVLKAAHELAQDDYVVTLGISPTFPSTGFGYIRQGEVLRKIEPFTCHIVDKFTEKPDVVRATQFVRSGQYTWNSGMFIWKTALALSEFERQQPDIHQGLETLIPTVDTEQFPPTLDKVWEDMPTLSIDYAIMEGAKRIAVIPVDIGWSDVGSWASLYDVLNKDRFGNCSSNPDESKRIILDSRNTLIYSDRLTVTIGVDDIIIVDAGDALLICHKDHAQDVRDVVRYLRDNGFDDYL